MMSPAAIQPPFASGRTADLHHWGEGLVLKLFRPGWNEAVVAMEAEKARAVHASGLPVPAVGEILHVDGRFGILYERITGYSLMHGIQTKPWRLLAIARWMADLHLEMHQSRIPTLPGLKYRLAGHIQSIAGLPGETRQTLLKMLALLPDGNSVCHGDFHPENIYITPKGPMILDWMDAARGNYLADVARTNMLLQQAVLPPDLPGRRLIELVRSLFGRVYLKRYFNGQPPDPDEWKAWQGVVLAARLAEDIPDERNMLSALLRSWLDGSTSEEGGL